MKSNCANWLNPVDDGWLDYARTGIGRKDFFGGFAPIVAYDVAKAAFLNMNQTPRPFLCRMFGQ